MVEPYAFAGVWGRRNLPIEARSVASNCGPTTGTRISRVSTNRRTGPSRGADDKWAFRIKASNGQIVATDGRHGHESKSDARDTLEKLMGGVYDGWIDEVGWARRHSDLQSWSK